MAVMTVITDVTRRLNRTLEAEESTLALTLIDDCELLIARQTSTGTLTPQNVNPEIVAMVVGTAVTRVLKNPEGYRSEGTGPYTFSIDTRAAAGFLMIRNEEWRLLKLTNPNQGMGVIAPKIGHRSTAFYNFPPYNGEWR